MSEAVKTRNLLIALFALVLAMGMTVAIPTNASAIDSPGIAASKVSSKDSHIAKTNIRTWVKAGKNLYRWLYTDDQKARDGYLQICESTMIPTYASRKIACSNPSFLSFKYKRESEDNTYWEDGVEVTREFYGKIYLTFKRFGAAKLKYTEYEFNDAVYDVTDRIRYVKYTNPIKMLKVGSTDYAKCFKKQPYYGAKSITLKGKLKVKVAKGWKLIHIRRVNCDIEIRDSQPLKKVKNGSKINIKNTDRNLDRERGWALEVTCYNKAKKYYSGIILFPGTRPYYALFG